MAKIIAGIGSSHSPMLMMEPPAWLARGEISDREVHLVDQSGRDVDYDDLLQRSNEAILKEIAPDVLERRYQANNKAIHRVAEFLLEANPDVVLLIGDDHKEVYLEDNMPALAVYWGETLPYRPLGMMKWPYANDLKTELWYPQVTREYPVASELARRLIGDLC